MAVAGDASARCFAADVVRAGLDPLTGRTLAFHHVPMAAWAGHLCDLLLAGALVGTGDTAAAGHLPTDVHPLVRDAYLHLEPSLPRPWRWMFAPRVVDINASVSASRRWLVATGVWTRRRTVFGSRFSPTGSAPTPLPPDPPGDAALRRDVLATLVQLAQFGSTGSAALRVASTPSDDPAVRAVLVTVDELVAWRTANPAMPGAGTGGMH